MLPNSTIVTTQLQFTMTVSIKDTITVYVCHHNMKRATSQRHTLICSIMEYGSTPYVGIARGKMAPYNMYKSYVQNSALTIVIAERSEANNRVLWAQQSQLAFISIYISIYLNIYISIKFARTSQRQVFKMASLPVFWVPSSKSWRVQSERSG